MGGRVTLYMGVQLNTTYVLEFGSSTGIVLISTSSAFATSVISKDPVFIDPLFVIFTLTSLFKFRYLMSVLV